MNGKARKSHHYYVCSYVDRYGAEAALEAHDGQKWLSLREDELERAVLSFFAQRILGPMRIKKLSKQLQAQSRSLKQEGKLTGTRIRQQVSEIDRKIKA